MRRARLLPALAVLALTAGCASGSGSDEPEPSAAEPTAAGPTGRPTAVPAADGEVTTHVPVTVLDDGGGAELCLGGVEESYPPQCGGPAIVGWDWADHAGDYEDASGVRWGDFLVTGTFDGASLTPTEVVPGDQVEPPAPPPDDDFFATPCPEPDGGWRVLDPQKATEISMDRAFRTAQALDGYADSWLDQSLNPAWNGGDPVSEEEAETLNDPHLVVVNVRVTRHRAAAERAIRAVWGGSLCVSPARYTQDELLAIVDDVTRLPGVLSSGAGRDDVELDVVYDDGSYQVWADEEYGAGVVDVGSALVDVGSSAPPEEK